jgi:iron(III) transport system permease protein
VPALNRALAAATLVLFLAPALFLLLQAVAPMEVAPLLGMAGTVLPGYAGNSLFLAAAAGALALLLGAGGAWLTAFHDFPGRRLLDSALVLPLVLPPYLVAIVYRELSHRYDGSPAVEAAPAAALLLALTLYPYVYLLTRAAFRRQAAVYIEAGQALGLGHWRMARRALLPLALPAMLLGTLLVVVETVSDFGTAHVLGIRTLTTAVHRVWFSQYDQTLAAQLALLTALPPLLLVAGYARLSRGRGFALLTNRPRPPQRLPLPAWLGWSAAAACALPVLLGFLWPMAWLLIWAAEALGSFRLRDLYGDLMHTLLLAATTTATALLLGTWLALNARTSAGPRWRLGTLAVLSLSYSLPAIALAIALLFLTGWSYQTAAGAWVANSLALVLLATTLRFTVFAFFGAESGLAAVPPRLDEALRCAGRRPSYGLWRVLLPLIRGPLAVGALLVFVITAKELTLSLVLQPFGYGSLALSIFRFADIDLYPPAALYAVCLVLVLVYPVLSLNRWLGGRP